MVSEDSQDLGWFAVVHRLRDLRDLDDPRDRQVPTEFHQLDDRCELLEVLPLRSSQWVLPEERDDHGAKIPDPLNAVSVHVLAVIVVPAVAIHLPASEEPDELLQDIAARGALRDRELRPHLPLERHLAAVVDGTAEAALSIHGAHDPSDGLEPFLLVF